MVGKTKFWAEAICCEFAFSYIFSFFGKVFWSKGPQIGQNICIGVANETIDIPRAIAYITKEVSLKISILTFWKANAYNEIYFRIFSKRLLK